MPTLTATAPADVITLFAAALHDGRLDDAVALYEPDAVDGSWGLLIDDPWGA